MRNWNIDQLFAGTKYKVIAGDGPVQSILLENEPYQGRPTEVFAYLGRPAPTPQPTPGMVCVHGGGGKAYKQWVEMWVERGYTAIAMDLGGHDADGARLANAGPEQSNACKFSVTAGWHDMWTYHAVAAVIRSHGILRAQPGVDPARIGITGISWGGYLTCITAGVDTRFACAIPVYGCGFLQDNSAKDWMEIFAAMTPAQRQAWHDKCDPSVYMGNITTPLLFVSGTNDYAYPLDIVTRSCQLPRGPVTMCIRPGMRHGHEPGWSPLEIKIFAEHQLRGGAPLPAISACAITAHAISAQYTGAGPIQKAMLAYTTDRGRWQERAWQVVPAQMDAGRVSATLPADAAACMLAIEDERGAWVNSDTMQIP